MTIHFLQHVPFEGPAMLESWASSRGFTITRTMLFDGDDFPHPSEIDLLVVMGGPMGVHDVQKYPWLTDEKEFIKQCLKSETKMLGICLGAQLLADALGARVYHNGQKEIGWHPIEWERESRKHPLFDFFPKQQKVLHWHGDTFEIPDNATNLAVSSACDHQGFLHQDRVLGLQFHLEMTKKNLIELIQNSRGELSRGGRYIQTAEEMLREDQLFNNANELMVKLMNRFIKL